MSIIQEIREQIKDATKSKTISIEDLEEADRWAKHVAKNQPHEDPQVLEAENELPGFVAYLTGMRTVALFGGMIREHPLLKTLDKRLREAEKAYKHLPASVLHSWEFFDVTFGRREGTLGSLYLSLADLFDAPIELVETIGRCCASRFGVYEQVGNEGDRILFRDVATQTELKAVNPRGYQGKPGEIWFARLFPAATGQPWFLMAPPYLSKVSLKDWQAYFAAKGIKGNTADDKTRNLMKHPQQPFYWLDYLDESSRGLLKGLPS